MVNLDFIHGSKMFFIKNQLLILNPKVGDFYFFPNYLMHTVYPFKEQMKKEDLFHLMQI